MSLRVPAELRGGVPVYRYRPEPGALPIAITRVDGEHLPHDHRHIHDFPLLLIAGSDVLVVAAGAAVDPTGVQHRAEAISLRFDPSALGVDDSAGNWSSHPLMFPFGHGIPGGFLHLGLAPDRETLWQNAIAQIDVELSTRETGFERAVLAQLTLLLVDVARLAAPLVEKLKGPADPTLAAVFDVVERRYGEQLSLRDVADEIGLTPGHLTTVVRRHTGRTVVDWITDRRMVAARRLLAETDLPIADVGRRVGYSDPTYFARVFRRQHGISAREWRT